jgi:hypothetical protein
MSHVWQHMIVMRHRRDRHTQNHDASKDTAFPPWQGRKVSIEEINPDFSSMAV